MITRFTVKCDSYIDACTVYGYFLDKHMCLSCGESNIEISVKEVEMKVDDSMDRLIDFRRSIDWLNRNNVKCKEILATCE